MMRLGQAVPMMLKNPSGSVDATARAMLLYLYAGFSYSFIALQFDVSWIVPVISQRQVTPVISERNIAPVVRWRGLKRTS